MELGRATAGAERAERTRRHVRRLLGSGHFYDDGLLCKAGSVDCKAERIDTYHEEEALKERAPKY